MVAPRAKLTSRSPAGFENQVRTLAQTVRALRRRAGWTLEQTAERIRIDLKHLQRIEAGGANVTFRTLLRIADAFGIVLRVPIGPVEKYRGAVLTLSENPLRYEAVKAAPTEPRGERATALDPEALVDRVGRRVAELRAEGGLTQRQLAELARVSLGLVQRVEGGRQRGVSLRTVARFAAALGSDVAALLSSPAGPPPRRGRPPKGRDERGVRSGP